MSRLILGAVLLAAAFGKLADDPSRRLSTTVFLELDGWLASFARSAERALPKVELVVALALLSGTGTLVGSVAAILLGVSFLAVSMSLPEGARCACFGILGGARRGAEHTSIAALIVLCSVISFWGKLAQLSGPAAPDCAGDEHGSA